MIKFALRWGHNIEQDISLQGNGCWNDQKVDTKMSKMTFATAFISTLVIWFFLKFVSLLSTFGSPLQSGLANQAII